MVDGDVRIFFNERQLNGIYDAGGLRAFVHATSNDEATEATLSDFASFAKDVDAYNPELATHVFYRNAFDDIVKCFAHICQNGVSTADPEQWLHLRGAIVGANRLSCAPSLSFGNDGFRSGDAIALTAVCCDLMFRAASRRVRHLAPLREGTPEELERRGKSIASDIVCGRGSAWLTCIDDLGSQLVGKTDEGIGWRDVCDEWAVKRLNTYLREIAELKQCSFDTAREIMIAQALSCAAIFDALQQRSFVRALPDGFVVPSEEISKHVFDVEIYKKLPMNCIVEPLPEQNLVGYCDLFGAGPVANVIWLPSDVHSVVALAYAAAVSNVKQ